MNYGNDYLENGPGIFTPKPYTCYSLCLYNIITIFTNMSEKCNLYTQLFNIQFEKDLENG